MTNQGPNPKWPGDFDEDSQRLKDLKAKVAQVREEDAELERAAIDPAKPSTGMGLGLKMGMDLVVATCFGFAIGYGLDWLFGTRPWLTLVFVGLGFAAGLRMILASAADYRKRIEEDDDQDWESIPAVEEIEEAD